MMRVDADSSVTKRQECFHHLRYIVISAGGLAMGMVMFLRLTITVAMVSMVNHTELYLVEHPNATEDDLDRYFDVDYEEVGEFDWSNEKQEKIITFYMITYTMFQIFTARLIMKYGLRCGVPISLSICALTNILTPIVSYWSWYWVLLLRLVNGCAASGIIPGMVYLIECWSAHDEVAVGVVLYQFVGNILGVASPLLGGMLANVHWKWAFYIPGLIGLLFCLLWFILVSDGPESSGIISQQELDHIKGRCIEQTKTSSGAECNGKETSTKLDVPYHQILKIREFYSLAIIWCTYCATSGGLLFLLPAYLNRVLHVPIDEIGALTSIAQIGSMFSMLWPNRLTSFFMDSCFNLSLTGARKAVTFISIFIANLTLLYLAYYHDHLVMMISINRFFHMTQDTIFLATVMSQFGRYGLSGKVYSMLNSLGCINSAIFCVLVGKFLDWTGETLECWSWVFVTIAVMNAIYMVIYMFHCHSEPIDVKSILSKQDEDSKS